MDRSETIAAAIRKRTAVRPKIGLILGSGWGKAVTAMTEKCIVPYAELEGMPVCGVEGHAGNFVFGYLEGVPVAAVQGRFHLYEGRPMEEVVLPVRVLHALGVRDLLLTNAAGGVNETYSVGDLMILSDHINFTGRNPLLGVKATSENPIFVDMTHVYDDKWSETIAAKCAEAGIRAHRGVYMQVLGPSYETPAEVRAYRTLGADAAGMSTAVEAICARYLKMRVAAVSCITNQAAGCGGTEITHAEVLEIAKKNEERFGELLKKIVAAL